jgi:hypothetical protein
MPNDDRKKTTISRTCANCILGVVVIFLFIVAVLSYVFGPKRIILAAFGFVTVLDHRVDFKDAVLLQHGDYPPTSSIAKRDRELIVEDKGFQISARGGPNTLFLFWIEVKNTGSEPLYVRVPAMTAEGSESARLGDDSLVGMTMECDYHIGTRQFVWQNTSAAFTNFLDEDSMELREKTKVILVPNSVEIPPEESLYIHSTIRAYADFDFTIDLDIKKGEEICGYRLLGTASK